GLEDRFNSNGSAVSKSCIEWNRVVATHGVLAHLPGAIANFAQAEGLKAEQCRELADAVRQSWDWSNYQQEICQRASWRPSWCTGVKTWERISAETDVLLIPHIADPDEILSHIPSVGPISQEHTLIILDSEGHLPGLHNYQCVRWPEELVLKLLQ